MEQPHNLPEGRPRACPLVLRRVSLAASAGLSRLGAYRNGECVHLCTAGAHGHDQMGARDWPSLAYGGEVGGSHGNQRMPGPQRRDGFRGDLDSRHQVYVRLPDLARNTLPLPRAVGDRKLSHHYGLSCIEPLRLAAARKAARQDHCEGVHSFAAVMPVSKIAALTREHDTRIWRVGDVTICVVN
jgi:hypothetical protein